MTKHQDILNFIATIRDSHSMMIEIFTKGSCLNFYYILRKVYPESVPYFNVNHIITKIDDRFYDITGQVDGKGYDIYYDVYRKYRLKRSINYMSKDEIKLKKS